MVLNRLLVMILVNKKLNLDVANLMFAGMLGLSMRHLMGFRLDLTFFVLLSFSMGDIVVLRLAMGSFAMHNGCNLSDFVVFWLNMGSFTMHDRCSMWYFRISLEKRLNKDVTVEKRHIMMSPWIMDMWLWRRHFEMLGLCVPLRVTTLNMGHLAIVVLNLRHLVMLGLNFRHLMVLMLNMWHLVMHSWCSMAHFMMFPLGICHLVLV